MAKKQLDEAESKEFCLSKAGDSSQAGYFAPSIGAAARHDDLPFNEWLPTYRSM